MNVLTLDWETTTRNKGNPFDLNNKAVVCGFKFLGMKSWDVYYDEKGYRETLQDAVGNADLLVGFNIKFDLHWLQREGVTFLGKRVWDTQLAEFILEDMKNPYPSLDQAAEKYGLPKKLDVVKTEYWDKGIYTPDIPREILSDYLRQDLLLTEQVYLKQLEQFEGEAKGKYALFKLQCLDLLTLQEMEWNGIYFNTEKARAKAEEIQNELDELQETFSGWFNNAPINIASNDHISCILYGGVISIDDRVPVGVFKTGAKIGEVRYKLVRKEYEFPRLVEPLKGSETAKEGYWKVNEDVLRQLKPNKQVKKILDLLDRYSKLDKLKNTYLIGWSNLIDTMGWEKDMIHGNLNQCVAGTGRLSSTKPNLQNADPTTKIYCESRYE